MQISNKIQELISNKLPFKKKLTSKGWLSFNAPCCVYNGEKRNDTKARGNLLFENGGFTYHCYNCRFTTGWYPGGPFHQKLRNLLKWFGFTETEVQELLVLTLKNKFDTGDNKPTAHLSFFTENKPVELPQGSRRIKDIIVQDNKFNEKFLDVTNYLDNRNPKLLEYIDLYWTPIYPDRFIIPGYYKDKIWGYASRTTLPNVTKSKYINMFPSGFLFNTNVIHIPHRKYIILTEGILDAVSIDGISCLGSTVTQQQMLWLDTIEDKEIVVLPDKDEAGKKLIEQAMEKGWSVSFPDWERNVKDAEEAVRKYGRLFTLDRILCNKVSNKFNINAKMKLWYL